MKRILSLLASLAVLAAAISASAYAEAPRAADFKANNGFFIFEGKENKTDVQIQADISDADIGVKIVDGGYYMSGNTCGGVVSNIKYDLNGLEATVYFKKVPEVTYDTDCWIAMDFLAAPRAFYTNDFNVETGNQGMYDLIRFGKPYMEVYEGVTNFGQVYNTQGLDPSVNDMFAVREETTLTVKISRNDDGTYRMTYAREGYDDFELPYAFPMNDVFPDGKAYFSVIASCEIAPADGWIYYITDIKNGIEMTEADVADIAKLREEAELAAKAEDANKEIAAAEGKATEAMKKAEAVGSDDAKAKARVALDAIAAAKDAVEEGDFDEAYTQSELARDYAKEANDLSKYASRDDADNNRDVNDDNDDGYDDYDDYDDYYDDDYDDFGNDYDYDGDGVVLDSAAEKTSIGIILLSVAFANNPIWLSLISFIFILTAIIL